MLFTDERNGLRHRDGKSVPDGDLQTEDVDAVIKFHNQQQEKLAEEMVHLARSMKENAKVASRIVKDDNRVCMCSDIFNFTNIYFY